MPDTPASSASSEYPEYSEDSEYSDYMTGYSESLITTAVLDVAARATLPFQAARADRNFGTAFWYNDLVEVAEDREVIRQYLVTAEPLTRYEIGQFTLRAGLAEPELPVDELVMPGFAKKWSRAGDLGVAVMPTVELHLHAERKGWSWASQEVTAGLAAQPEDIAGLGAEPVPAYALGHEVTGDPGHRRPERPQTLLAGTVTRTADGTTRWSGPLPEGCAGAPVFAGLPHAGGQVKLVCLGLLLPGGPGEARGPGDAPGSAGPRDSGTVATFDKLRPAIHALTPSPKRHWWQRG
ncbi:hypothetical protein [Streptomyces sp.]|uniref:hypothetical protein n=1 Tax=Streptomyces sp. TaxID=1931 RepID=UPI002F418B52